jgi:Tol biopolymer transport system component
MNADGSAELRLTHDDAADWCPDWSQDGGRIAFTRGSEGDENLFLMEPTGQGSSNSRALGVTNRRGRRI